MKKTGNDFRGRAHVGIRSLMCCPETPRASPVCPILAQPGLRSTRVQPVIREMTPLISFRGVCKAFGPKVVYRGLDLDVYRGEVITIVGGSGVGKSVLLKLLIGLLPPDGGSIVFDGLETHGHDRRPALAGAAAHRDAVPERRALRLAQRRRERGLRARGALSAETEQVRDRDRVAWALGLVGLPGVEEMRPADLSGGMRKRVGLARAIAVQPEVVLYDEPTTGLDPINTARVNHMIMGLQEKFHFTSVVVTHDMKSAFTVSDRMAMVHSGVIICQGPVDEFRASTDPRVSDFIEGRAPVRESVEALLSSG